MPQKKESGIALVASLFILIILLILGTIFTMMMASETNISVRESQSTQALYLADAGIQYAQYSAGNTDDWNNIFDNTVTKNIGSGSFSIHYYSIPSYMAVSSWGYVYDSTLDYSIVRQIAARFSK